jgi:hypothetical protein
MFVSVLGALPSPCTLNIINMKYILLLIAFPLIMVGCGEKIAYDLNEVKENDDLRNELFSTIINDQEMLSQFLDQLTGNENGINQLIMDVEAMQNIFSMQNMYFMAQAKPEIMLTMVNNLAHITKNDSSVRLMMMNLPPMQQIIRDQGRDLARK